MLAGGEGGSESLPDQFTQEDEGCTQMEPFNDEDASSQGNNGGESGSQRAWGRLISLADGASKTELWARPAKREGGPCNEYCLGRGKMCDIRVDDARISSQHCHIFCEEVREAGRPVLKTYIEDSSSNGTFINGEVRLRKGQRRALNSGDEICLIKCKDRKEQESASFVFQQLHTRPVARRLGAFSPLRQVSSLRSSPSGSLGLYGGGRRIEEFYDIRNEIGRGTSGRVHVGVDRKTGEEWAIKVIETRRFGLTPGLSPKELVQEAEVLRAIHHPSIVKLQDIFQSEGAIYLVMELVRGGDLFDRILERGRYSEPAARELMFRILHAVEYLHSRHIVHRDLKPENILLVHKDSDVEVKITDFGLAKRTTRDGLKTFCGTPQYFAPEVLKRRNSVLGTGRYGREADMWSLGVILYILLSGTPPFDDNTLFDQIRTASYSFEGEEWTSVSEQAKDLVRKLLTTSPITRLQADQALRHPWFSEGSVASQGSEDAITLSMPTSSMMPQEATEGHELSSRGRQREVSPSSTNTADEDDEDEDMQQSGFGSVPPLAVTATHTVMLPPSKEPRRRKSLHPKPLALQLSLGLPTARKQGRASGRASNKRGHSAAAPAASHKAENADGGELEDDKIIDYSSSEEVTSPSSTTPNQSCARSGSSNSTATNSKPPPGGPSCAMFPPPPRIPGSHSQRMMMPRPGARRPTPGPIDFKVNNAAASPPPPPSPSSVMAPPSRPPSRSLPTDHQQQQQQPASATRTTKHEATRQRSKPQAAGAPAAGTSGPVVAVLSPSLTPTPSQQVAAPLSKKAGGAGGTQKRVSHHHPGGEGGGGVGSSAGKKRKVAGEPDSSQRRLDQFLMFRTDPLPAAVPATASR